MGGFEGYFRAEALRRPGYAGQLAAEFQAMLAARYGGADETACVFTQTVELPDGHVVDGALDARGQEDGYLGGMKFWGKRVIEIMPGSGWISAHIAIRAAELVVLDAAPAGDAAVPPAPDDLAGAREEAAERVRRSWWFTRQALGFEAQAVYADLFDPPDDLGRFDVAVLANALSAVEHPYRLLQKAAALTEQFLIISEPAVAQDQSQKGNTASVTFIPEAAGARWLLPPAAMARMLASLGFGDLTVGGCAPQIGGKLVPHYTIVARRAGRGELRINSVLPAAPEPAAPAPAPVAPAPAALDDNLPVPPPEMRLAVSGTDDVEAFLVLGQAGFNALAGSLERAGVPIPSLGRVLDFGCGVGRVMRYWHGRPGLEVFGTDIDPASIAWARENLPFTWFDVNKLDPELSYADGYFGLVYAQSVFAHLPEALQQPWLRELQRVLRPGGMLYFTTHGKSYRELMEPEPRAKFDAGLLIVGGAELPGTPKCAAFHPPGYVEAEMLRPLGLTLVEFLPEGAAGNPTQDSWLVRKA